MNNNKNSICNQLVNKSLFSYLLSFSSSSVRWLYGLLHSSSWHCPQTVRQGSPYRLQLQRSVVQAVVQLQCIIFGWISRAAFISDIIGISEFFFQFPTPIRNIHVTFLFSPDHDLIVGSKAVKFGGGCSRGQTFWCNKWFGWGYFLYQYVVA